MNISTNSEKSLQKDQPSTSTGTMEQPELEKVMQHLLDEATITSRTIQHGGMVTVDKSWSLLTTSLQKSGISNTFLSAWIDGNSPSKSKEAMHMPNGQKLLSHPIGTLTLHSQT